MKGLLSFAVAGALSVSVSAAPSLISGRSNTTTPTVNLGYEVHQGSLNATGDYYLFSSIPYAQQPVGDLRFQKPVAITGSSLGVNNGTTETMCMQAYPQWIIDLFAAGYGLNSTAMAAVLYTTAGQTESCLVLDVYVPRDIFEKGTAAEAPVLVWIHGGGFTYGSKLSAGNPSGLVARSKVNGGSGMIVVSINYRLGMFGWLGGDSNNELTPNLGLYDQLMALEWVQQYIGKFGGNPDKVTVMGESAGASSILHHITGYGGTKAPFAAAIPQSPAFQYNLNATKGYLLTMQEAASATSSSISSLSALKGLESDTLKSINQAVVQQAGQGQFNFGPVVDGTYVPTHPQVLLLNGQFDHSLKLLVSHTSNESVPFVSTAITTEADVKAYIEAAVPNASAETVNTMLTQVYPDVLNGSYPWTTQFARTAQIATDTSFACVTNYLATAFGNASHNEIFAYPPGYHAGDVNYVFFNGDTTTLDNGLPVNPDIAFAMQDYIVRFVSTGSPDGAEGLPAFPEYGADGKVIEFTYGGVVQGLDDMKNERCAWIQQAMAQGLI